MNDSERIDRYFATRAERTKTLSGVITGVGHDATTGKQTYWDVQVAGSTVRVPLGSAAPTLGSGTAVTLEQSGSPSAASFQLRDAVGPVGTVGAFAFPDGATVGGKTYPSGDWIFGNIAGGNIHIEYDTGRLYHRIGNTVMGIEYANGDQLFGHATYSGGDWVADAANVLVQSTGIKLRNALVDALTLDAANGIRMYSGAVQRVSIKPEGDGWLGGSDKIAWDTAGNVTLAGTVAAGGVDVGTTGNVRGGQSAWDTGAGFWLGYAGGAYKFSIGDSSTGNTLTWDGTVLRQRGAITIISDIDPYPIYGYRFSDGSTQYGALSGWHNSTDRTVSMWASSETKDSFAEVAAYTAQSSGKTAVAKLQAFTTGAGQAIIGVTAAVTGSTGFVQYDGDEHRFVGSVLLNGARHRVVCLGDSLSDIGGYDSYLQTALGTTVWKVVSGGVGGRTSTEIAAEWTYFATPDTEYVVVLCGINDIVQGASAATIENNLANIYAAAHAAGMKVVAVTITPWKASAYWTSGKQVITDAVNTWILNTATSCDYKVDSYTPLEGEADTLNALYDSGDGLHPNTSGYSALATVIHAGVTWTAGVLAPVLTLSNANVAANQNLSTSDSPTFRYLNVARALRTSAIKTTTTDLLAFQTNAGVTGITFDTLRKRVGIGVDAPLVALHVAGQIYGDSVFSIGAYPAGYFAFNIETVTTGLSSHWGIYAHTTADSTATVAQYQIASRVVLAAGLAQYQAAGMKVYDATKGAGASIGTLHGMQIDAQTGGTDANYGLKIAAPSGATENYGLWVDGNVVLAATTGTVTLGSLAIAKNAAVNDFVAVTVAETGSNSGVKIGVLNSSDDTYSLPGIWFHAFGSITPSFTNYAYLYDGANTIFNTPSGQGFRFRIGNSEKARLSAAGFVFNYDAEDLDFYVKTDTGYEAIVVDASNDSIAVMNHASGKVGFFGGTPVVKQSLASYTGAVRSSEYYATGDPENYAANVVDLNALRTAYENLRIAFEDMRYKLGLTTFVTSP
jgi:lysophospholipase L1-like esterase